VLFSSAFKRIARRGSEGLPAAYGKLRSTASYGVAGLFLCSNSPRCAVGQNALRVADSRDNLQDDVVLESKIASA
jgi:hypothetical protein